MIYICVDLYVFSWNELEIVYHPEGGSFFPRPFPMFRQLVGIKETILERADFYADWFELKWSGRTQPIDT